MTFDFRGRRTARLGLILGRSAWRPMRSFPSRILPHVAYRLGLPVALGMDFLSPGGRATPLPSNLCGTPDRLHAQPGRLGHPCHRGDLTRGALDDLLQADRAGACPSRRSVHSPAAMGALGVPGRTGESDHRRHAGAAHGEDRAGYPCQARPCAQGQSPDLSEQPVLGDLGSGCI